MMRSEGPWLRDEQGRRLILRGVNLAGSSKVPCRPNGATHIREGFFEHRDVSFVGRPFPLAEADEHLARLRAWGLTFLRLLVTWEAVEHAGPGVYDQEYLDYLYQVVRKAGEHGFDLFIDPHQDVWSRFSGGDGAPGWTLEAVGLDMTRFAETGAAIVHATHGDPFPRMIWPTNESKLAAATMFTLFFGGNDFAPATRIGGEPVQEYLQRHYLAAMRQVALCLKDLPNVVGYDTMNEPLAGYIGWQDLATTRGPLRLGETPSPFQAMLLGAGYPQEVDVWRMTARGARRAGRRWVNPQGVRVWRDGFDCVWRRNGVWEVGADGRPYLARPDHFARAHGRAVDFSQDYYRPFADRYAQAIRSADPDALIFVETGFGLPAPQWGPEDAAGIVYAPHWYDGYVLFLKRYSPWLAVDGRGRVILGPRRIRRAFAGELAAHRRDAAGRLGDVPVVIGEFGIPFDLNEGAAFRTGDYRAQVAAMDRSFRAMEDALVSCTVWNYTPDNSNRRGDQWNDEDLSIFSRDQQADPADIHSGGRALVAVVRPYARRIAGDPLRMAFDRRRGAFELEFRHDPAVSAPTEVFVPAYQYPHGCLVEVSDGTYELRQAEQSLIYRHTGEREVHTIRLRRRSGR